MTSLEGAAGAGGLRPAARPVRWGVVGTGTIAAVVAEELHRVPGAQLAAVASRDPARAAAFAARHGAARHGTLPELLGDGPGSSGTTSDRGGVDVVYVAVPHAQHAAVASAAVRAGIPVLVEKPLACTAAAGQRLADLAAEHGVFVMEALWTRFQPLVVRLLELVAAGGLGEVRSVGAELGLRQPFDPASRMWDPAQGGGALLDVGVYGVAMAQALLGRSPSRVQVSGVLGPTGVDAEAALLLTWPGGATAQVTASMSAQSWGGLSLAGTGGRAVCDAPLHRPSAVRLWRDGAHHQDDPEVWPLQLAGRGYVHMISHVQDCLTRGLLQSPVLPLADSVAVARVLDEALDALGAAHRDDPDPSEDSLAVPARAVRSSSTSTARTGRPEDGT